MVAELAGAVGRVAQHFGSLRLMVEEVGGHLGVGGVAGREVAVGDQAGVVLVGHVGLEAVPVGV